MDSRCVDLSKYRIQQAMESLEVARDIVMEIILKILLIVPIMRHFML